MSRLGALRIARQSEPSPMYGRRPTTQTAFGGQSYDGASTDAYSQRWAINESAPDAELANSLGALRSRSADLVRNNPLAYGIIETLQRGVIGRGPRFKSTATGVADQINALFVSWSARAGWDGVASWSDVCDDLVSASCISGDVLILWPDVGDGTEPRVDLVDARRIDTPTDATPECAACRLGVGYDKYGRVLGYYVRATDDGSTLRANYRWFPLFRDGRINAVLFRRPSVKRPRQSRSVGILAPILHQLKEVPAYLLTENRRATQAAKNFVIIETPDPKAISDAFENASGTGDGDASIDELMGRSYGNIPDGSMMSLGMGEKATIANPPSVNGGIGDYIESGLRTLSPATGLPFEEAFRNYADLNFSNARTIAGLASACYAIWRQKVEPALCTPTIKLLVRYWWANGLLGRIPWNDDLTAGSWAWDVRAQVDPLKEGKANSEAVLSGQKSIQEVAAEQGRDWRQIIDENLAAEAYEAERRKALGLAAKVESKAPAQAATQEPAEPDEDDTEKDDEELTNGK